MIPIRPTGARPRGRSIDLTLVVSRAFGVLMLAGAALNTVLVATRPELYRMLGEWFGAPEVLARLWGVTFAAHPALWVPMIGIGYELVVGLLALARDPHLRLAGLLGIAAFHLALLSMGLWVWAVPVLAVLSPVIVHTWWAWRPGPRSATTSMSGGR